ncbi:PE-PGRS family protein [Dyadobacter sandarakinus]|uniref:PE-PGRS family protein n=1 Tax=Dyadobacter sandarakinus TaxID=2747268 RepID=A0ABX7IBB5_9BACT|nr:PE-PGRS family protein [Dyadobacter sandarakinus]QRR03407.1 PE-PGRS family protein [Dyadobacter sandarakinus]
MSLYKKQGSQIGLFFYLLVFCLTCACGPDPDPAVETPADFETKARKYPIQPGIVDEASGLAASKSMPGFLWTHQDSGAPPALYLISPDGKRIKTFNIPGAQNHDWEDVAMGPGPVQGVNYLYIGDTGNNNSPVTPTNTIYRVPEIVDSTAAFGIADKITFSYPDGLRDAEAVMVDPATRDILIISKESNTTGLYRLAYPQSTNGTIVAEKMGNVPDVAIATSADISPDGSEILVRTYIAVYYWKKKADESIAQTLLKPSVRQFLVELEPQGESVCFDQSAAGFYTLSEKGKSAGVSLNYYKRK